MQTRHRAPILPAAITTCVLLSLLVVAPLTSAVHAAWDRSTSAVAVWGQPDFVSVDRHCNHPSSMTLCGPTQVVPDDQGNLWVTDLVQDRVLMFPPDSAIAGKVFGQYGSMITHGCDQAPPRGSAYPPAPNRYTLCQPAGLAIDHQGTLYVADSINNRILLYFHAAQKPADAPADRVLGQSDFHASASNDLPAGGSGRFHCPAPRPASACTLNSPMELSLTSEGDLLVPDLDNHRVLLWSAASLARLQSDACAHSCFLPASRVWGQYGSFVTNVANSPTIPPRASARCTPITFWTPASACTLSEPWSAVADARGDLVIADTANSRVLEYDHALATGRQDATAVYGQGGSFVTNLGNEGGVSASSLWHPLGLALDPSGNLWVTDYYNMRVLGFPPPGSAGATTALHVLGQRGSFSKHLCSVSAEGLCGPTSLAFDAAGRAFVADGFSDRVLGFFAPVVALARVVHLTIQRRDGLVIFHWHSEGAILGFNLYAGTVRLTTHLIRAHPHGDYRYQLRWLGRGPYGLGVILSTGQQVTV